MDWLAISLNNQASLLAKKMDKVKEAFPLTEEAYQIATTHGLNALAEQIKPILESIRAKLR